MRIVTFATFNFVSVKYRRRIIMEFLSTRSGSVGIYSTYEILILGRALINYVTSIIVLGEVEC